MHLRNILESHVNQTFPEFRFLLLSILNEFLNSYHNYNNKYFVIIVKIFQTLSEYSKAIHFESSDKFYSTQFIVVCLWASLNVQTYITSVTISYYCHFFFNVKHTYTYTLLHFSCS